MHHGSTVKSVFNVLCNLNDQGFQTWISRAYDLATMYQIDMNSCTDLSSSQFKKFCYERLKNSFMNSWVADLCNRHESSILRTYSLNKKNFGIENYLKYIFKPKFRIALSMLRASSHDLEIERGCFVPQNWIWMNYCAHATLLKMRNILWVYKQFSNAQISA